MSKKLLFLFLFILPLTLSAQILPKEGSSLNYRIIGFSFPADDAANNYKIEIANGNHGKPDSFATHIIRSLDSKDNKLVLEVPSFGQQYTWRVTYLHKKKVIKTTPFYHFSARLGALADTAKLRLHILQPAMAHEDDYVAVDAGGVLYDMKGNPVWYVPDTNGLNGYVADMKFTERGSITFLHGKGYEINYDGDILWQAPKYDSVSEDTMAEAYHHEFVRLSNGHYMVLGMQVIMCRQSSDNGIPIVLTSKTKTYRDGYKRGRFGTIIEYDEKGNIVWCWKSAKYLLGSDFDYFKGVDSNLRFDPHDNAFFFDEQNKCIYLGFRNLNRIMKIEYPSGKVLRIYGDVYKPGMEETGGGMFCNQHSIRRSQDGDLYIYDNNSCRNTDSLPSVIMFEEPGPGATTLRKKWEFQCPVESGRPMRYPGGGNALELPDRNMFICMGSDYSKLLIVTRQKKILWSALPERYLETDEKWAPMHEYRANIITRAQLEHMIWSAEKLAQHK